MAMSGYQRLNHFVYVTCIVLGLGAAITINDCPKTFPRDRYLVVHRDSCFHFEFITKLDYPRAEQRCLHRGGYLANVKNQDINKFITRQLANVYFAKESFWIGLNDREEENVYKWSDGTPNNYDNFDTSQGPYNHVSHNIEDCIVINPKNGKWEDHPCTTTVTSRSKFYSICEYSTKPKVDIPKTPQPVLPTKLSDLLQTTRRAATLKDCPKHLKRDTYLKAFGSSCYLFAINRGHNRRIAENICVRNGGFLASLGSQSVNNFIWKQLAHYGSTNPSWIGLNDIEKENVYRWADGTDMSYNNFDEDKEPTSSAAKDLDCVVVDPKTGKWLKHKCNRFLGFDSYYICEFPLYAKKATSKTSSPTETPKTATSPVPSTEEPKSTMPSTEEPKSTMLSTNEPKSTMLSTNEPKSTMLSTNEPKSTMLSTNEPKSTMRSTEEPKSTMLSTNGPKSTMPTTDEQESTMISTEEPKTTMISTEEPKSTILSTEEPKTTMLSTEEPKTAMLSTEEPKSTMPTSDEPKTTMLSTEEPKSTMPTSDELKTTMLSTEEPKSTILSTEEPTTITEQPTKTDSTSTLGFIIPILVEPTSEVISVIKGDEKEDTSERNF